MTDIITISTEIENKIKEIDLIRKEIKPRGEAKAQAESEYDKSLAITLIKLENGASFTLENEVIKEPPKSIMDKLAKGICWKEKLEMEKANVLYKSVTTNLDS